MESSRVRHVVCDTPKPGIRVVRFVRPDVRAQLYDQEAISDCSLHRELQAAALADLAGNETLIVNFGLIEPFPTHFYRLMLKVREAVQAKKARLLLCCFTPNVRECFDLLGGSKVFEIFATEERAIHEASRRAT